MGEQAASWTRKLRQASVRREWEGALGEEGRVRLYTVSLMRWVAVIGQLFTILFVHLSIGIELPIGALLPAVLLTFALNLAFHFSQRGPTRLGEQHALVIFSYDIVQLTYLLCLTGGLNNPFSLFLLLPVALASMTLSYRAMLVVCTMALASILFQLGFSRPLPWPEGILLFPRLYTVAMAIALGSSVLLVAAYIWRVAEDARQQAAALAATQMALAREQQLSALGSQAAAAAHLLGSPLGTINVIAKELVRELPARSLLKEDAQEMLDQVRRCRGILATLAKREDHDEHARFTAAPLSDQLREVARRAQRPEIFVSVNVDVAPGAREPMVSLPPEIRHSLANLVENAVEFARSRVEVSLRVHDPALQLSVQDDGPGFAPEVLDWLGEPYLSTRQGKGGLGLGVFIANTLLARTGAKLHFRNNNTGALVEVAWPDGLIQEGWAQPRPGWRSE